MSRPTLQQLSYLVALADEGHFGRAADACSVSQPGLSSQILELERRLGLTLIERLAKGARLTPEGSDVVARARRILSEVDELIDATQTGANGLVGPLNVGAIPTAAPYVLGDFVPTILRTHPNVSLRFEELITRELLASLRSGQLDLGICALPVEGHDIVGVPVLNDHFLLAFSMRNELARADGPVSQTVLRNLNVLLLDEGHCLRDQALALCASVRVQPTDLRATSIPTLVQMVAADVGVTLLPVTAAAVEARSGNGIAVRPIKQAPKRTLALVWRASSPRDGLYRSLARDFSTALARFARPNELAEQTLNLDGLVRRGSFPAEAELRPR